MGTVSRRVALFAGSLPALPQPAVASVPAMAAEFHRARADLPGLERARRRAAWRHTQAEAECHSAEDALSDVVTALEAAPLGTLADAEALRGVALVLVKKGRDPARFDLLAAAETAIAEFGGRKPDVPTK